MITAIVLGALATMYFVWVAIDASYTSKRFQLMQEIDRLRAENKVLDKSFKDLGLDRLGLEYLLGELRSTTKKMTEELSQVQVELQTTQKQLEVEKTDAEALGYNLSKLIGEHAQLRDAVKANLTARRPNWKSLKGMVGL